MSNAIQETTRLPGEVEYAIDRLPIPAPGSRWQHQGTKGVYVAIGPCKGRLPGGQWREGVVYKGEADGQTYWRCLRSWADAMRLIVDEQDDASEEAP